MAQQTRGGALLALASALLAAAGAAAAEPCGEPGRWYDPAAEEALTTAEALSRLRGSEFILLGERHDDAAHHRWQQYTLAALHGRGNLAAVGFEMLPRRTQEALDRWVAGKLSAEAFFEAVDWQRVWGFPQELYRPLLELVRMHRLPAAALNVDREAVRAVRREGWAALDTEAREGVGRPAPLEAAQRERLEQAFQHHPKQEEIDTEGFIEAQRFWDRAMAEALEAARRRHGAPVAGIVGRGHAAGHGIPHQLADLGHAPADIAVLLPHDAAEACPGPEEADLVFLLEPRRDSEDGEAPPRMGVAIAPAQDASGVRILEVLDETPAARAGLRAEDRVLEAAGQALERPEQLQAIVERQAPGTWLPLLIERGGEERQEVVRFPPP